MGLPSGTLHSLGEGSPRSGAQIFQPSLRKPMLSALTHSLPALARTSQEHSRSPLPAPTPLSTPSHCSSGPATTTVHQGDELGGS